MTGRAILTAMAVLWLGGCTAVRPVVPPPGPIAEEYRETQADLRQQQAELAVTGQKIEDQGRGLVADLTRLEESIAGAAPEAGEAERQDWLRQAQALREQAETHQADIEGLNRQLAEERETARKQDRKFNEYEFAVTGQFSERDAENAQLRVENKAVKWQRNTLLAIVITAVVLVVLIIAIKVLRFFKVIPF